MQASLGSTGCHCWLLVPSRAQVWGLHSLWRMVLKPRVSSESHERLRQITALEFLIQKVWGGVLECSFQIPWWRWHSWSGIPLRESLQQRNPFTDGDRFCCFFFFHRSSIAIEIHWCAYKSPRLDLVKIQILIQLVWLGIWDPAGLPRWLSGKISACQCRRPWFNPWVRMIPWRRAWQPIPVFLPQESHGQRSLAGYSRWGCKESDTAEAT